MKLFRHNLLVTNGTIPYFDLPRNCSILISLDGTEKDNDAIRGRGVFQKVAENIKSSDRKIAATTTIHRFNFQKIPEIVEKFLSFKNIICSYFTFYTPEVGENFSLCLTEDEREKTINALLIQKKKYGHFIANSLLALNLMRREHRENVIKNCIFKRGCYCLDSTGNRKLPCVFGPKADCSRCGNWEMHHMNAIEMKDWESIRIAFRLFGVDTFS